MKKLILCCVTVCVFAACSKHHDDPKPAPSHLMVTRMKTSGDNTYSYDDLGRLVRIDNSNMLVRTDLTYTKDSVIQVDHNTQGDSRITTIYHLDKDTLCDRAGYIVGDDPLLSFTFAYDGGRHLTEQVFGDAGKPANVRDVYYYSNGDMDSSKRFFIVDGRLLSFTKYEYYTDRPNWFSQVYIGVTYTGVGSAHLLKKEIDTEANATTSKEYTYEFDADGRPVKRHATLDDGFWFDQDYTWITLQL